MNNCKLRFHAIQMFLFSFFIYQCVYASIYLFILFLISCNVIIIADIKDIYLVLEKEIER